MAKDSPLTYLPGEDPETLKANAEYQQALANLTASLDARKNRLFDPAMASFAAAMLEPGHGGSFGEALGRSIGAYSQAETAEQKLAQEEAAKRVELAQLGLQLQQQREADRGYLNAINPPARGALSATEGEPSAGAAPATSGLPAQGPAGAKPFGIQIAPPRPGQTREQYLAGARASRTPIQEALKQWEEIERKSLEVKEGGVFDTRTGMFYPSPTGGVEKRPVQLPDGTVGNMEFPGYIAKMLDDAIFRGDMARYNSLVNQWLTLGKGSGAPQAPGAASAMAPAAAPGVAPATAPAIAPGVAPAGRPTRPQTVEEQEEGKTRREIAAAGAKAEAEGIAKGAVEDYTKAQSAYAQAPTMMSTAENIIALVNSQPEAFRLLSNPGIAATVGRVVEEGIRIGNFGSISIPAAELATYKLNQKQLDALNMYANQIAIAKAANRQMVRVPGEGTTSDFESKMANAVLEVKNASPEVIKLINEFTMMRARHAELRFEKLSELRSRGMSIADAMTSQEMRDIRAGYESALRGLAQRNARILGNKLEVKKPKKTSQPASSDLVERLDAALRGE